MIYIHGGGFLSGSSNFYKGKYLVENNVVLVVINYRLGVLGKFNHHNTIVGLVDIPTGNLFHTTLNEPMW